MENPSIISSQGSRSNVQKYRKQVIFMLGAVVVSFFICLLPFRALTLWIIIVPPEQIASLGIDGYYTILYFCRVMLYLNSAMNPILYNLMSSKFREGFLRLLGCKSLIRTKLGSGVRKGTFHTTSTNLSSSNQNQHSVNGSVRNSKRISVGERERNESLRRTMSTRYSLNHRISNGTIADSIAKIEPEDSSISSIIPASSTSSTANELTLETATSSIVKCANILFLPSITKPIVEEEDDEKADIDDNEDKHEQKLLNGTTTVTDDDLDDDNQTLESCKNNSYHKKAKCNDYDLLKQDDKSINGINGKCLLNGDSSNEIDEDIEYCLNRENFRRARESLV